MNVCKNIPLFALVFILSSAAIAQAGVIDKRLVTLLQELDSEQEVAVIISMTDQLDLKTFKHEKKKERRVNINKALREKANSGQRPVHSFLKEKKAARVISYWLFNGMAATVRADQVKDLADLPGVDTVRLDDMISIDPSTPAISGLPEWNLDAVQAPAMWAQGHTGDGVTVASMDTGVDILHPDLAISYRGGDNSWFDPGGERATPFDSHGHGTQTMGIMVGGDKGGTAIGLAPGANWIAVKMFNDAGSASYSAVHQGFQWLLDPDDNPNTGDLPDIVNNSWGYPQLVNRCFTEFQQDIQALKASGVAVVFSAGNGGSSDATSESPANYARSLAVGAVDEFLTIADFSSRGPSACPGVRIYPQLVAPGINLRTSDRTSDGVFPDSYIDVRGTSYAAPHVSGAMALLLGAQPDLTVEELESALKLSTYDPRDLGPDNDYGNGLVDVAGAWDLLQSTGGNSWNCSAAEIKHDGIDLDCNSYDLTINIILAEYTSADEKLNVEATSSFGNDAGLILEDYGPMKWTRKKARWTISVSSVFQDPVEVTVIGLEGSESADTTVVQGGKSGGGRGGEKRAGNVREK
jgi:serine protease AprX